MILEWDCADRRRSHFRAIWVGSPFLPCFTPKDGDLAGVGFWSVPILSVGASGVWGGWEGLYGRPPSLSATFTHPVINHTGLRGRP